MAGVTIQMTAKKQFSLQQIYEKMQQIEGAEHVSKSVQEINDVSIWMMVYEKFYFRTGGYTSVAVVLTEHGQEQKACVVASGGGEGMTNCSYGANRNLAKACALTLESCGFEVAESDLDIHSKGFVERFLD